MLDELKKGVMVYIYDKDSNDISIKKVDSFTYNCSHWQYNHLLITEDRQEYVIFNNEKQYHNVVTTSGQLISTDPTYLSLNLLSEIEMLTEQIKKYEYAIKLLRRI